MESFKIFLMCTVNEPRPDKTNGINVFNPNPKSEKIKTRGRQDLFARKKAANNDGFDFFLSFAHSSSIFDILFFVKFSGSGSGKSVSSIGVFLRSFLVKLVD